LPIPCWCINCESYVRILYAVMHDAGPSLFYLCGLCAVLRSCECVRCCGLVKLEQNSSCAVALSCVTLVCRLVCRYLSLRSCGQVLGTPAQGHRITSYGSWHTHEKKKTGLPTSSQACPTGPPVDKSALTPALWPCAALSQWPCTFCSDPGLIMLASALFWDAHIGWGTVLYAAASLIQSTENYITYI